MKFFRGTALFLFCMVLAFSAALPASAAPEENRVVRVGWYESPFNLTDQFGRRSGYAYEYQQKIAAYTGWTYEYVDGSWPELFQMLERGEIDLMSDVSFTEERAEQMLFCPTSMGAEDYYICVSVSGTSGIAIEDISTLNGRTIGVYQDSYQAALLEDWIAGNGVQAEIVELMGGEAENIGMLDRGEIDAYVSLDAYGSVHNLFPLWKVGSSNFYFVVSKDRPDLLQDLNAAMRRIQDENRCYNQELQEKYLDSMSLTGFLTQNELAALSGYGTIRVGYQDDYLPFCDQDPETGELTGALRDFLDAASASLQNAALNFEPVAYPSTLDALDALNNGEVDCVFPVNMTVYDAEQYGVLLTSSRMQTQMYVSVRSADKHSFSLEDDVTAAITSSDLNYANFLMDCFPNWNTVRYKDREACCQAVANGEADCAVTCSYRLNRNADLFEKYSLATVSTGRTVLYTFATGRQDDYLCSILNKVSGYVSDSVIDASLASYSYVDRQYTLVDFLRLYIVPVLSALCAILAVILMLLIKSRRAEEKAVSALRALQSSLEREEHQRKELSVTKHKAYTDPLTGVKSKRAYLEALDSMRCRIIAGEPVEFAAVVFDVNDLKKVNDLQGHEAGDRHIKAASSLICEVFKHSPIFRTGGDEFVSILEGRDYQNRTILLQAFNQLVEENQRNGQVVVSAGFAEYDPEQDESCNAVFQRADEAMYERKRFLKGGREIR